MDGLGRIFVPPPPTTNPRVEQVGISVMSNCSLSHVKEMRQRAVNIPLNLLGHFVRRLQVLPKVFQLVPVQTEQLWPDLDTYVVALT